jgi:hypothetical protein
VERGLSLVPLRHGRLPGPSRVHLQVLTVITAPAPLHLERDPYRDFKDGPTAIKEHMKDLKSCRDVE